MCACTHFYRANKLNITDTFHELKVIVKRYHFLLFRAQTPWEKEMNIRVTVNKIQQTLNDKG